MNKRGNEPEQGKTATGRTVDVVETANNLRILVVEDDPQALSTTTGALEALGHFAAGASSAEVARARFLDGAFDVLIADIGLPGLSGDEFVETIRRDARAPLEVIYATGRPRPPESDAIWLQKPYLLEDLAAALLQARQRLCSQRAQDDEVTAPEGC